MSLIGASGVRVFKSKLLLSSVIIERTDRRIAVGTIKRHAADDVDARAQHDRVGRKPFRLMHGADDIFFAANKSDVQCVTRNAVAGARHHGKAGQTRFMLVVLPERRQNHVGQYEIDDWHSSKDEQPSRALWSKLHGTDHLE